MIALPVVLQEKDYECAKACGQSVMDFLQVPEKKPNGDPQRQPIQANPVYGCSPDTLEAALWGSGVSLQTGNMTIADLRHHTRLGRPVICLATEDEKVGHYVVVAGLTRRKHEGRTVPHVRYMDPLCGIMDEPVEAFEARWFDADRKGVKIMRWGIACDF